MTVSDGVVIGVELIAPAGVAGLMTGKVRLQQEGFEEPGGVGQVPFGWAGIRHALQAEILRFEGLDQRLGSPSHIQQGLQTHGSENRWPDVKC